MIEPGIPTSAWQFSVALGFDSKSSPFRGYVIFALKTMVCEASRGY